MRPVHTYWLCQYLQMSQLGEQTQLRLKYRHIHINISPYVLVLAQLVPAIPEAVWVWYVLSTVCSDSHERNVLT